MENIIKVLAALLITTAAYGQKGEYNLKDGAIAEGYDVVAYFDGDATEGKSNITSVIDGVKYQFATPENKAKFDAAPGEYIPQYGGWCAYAVAENKSKVGIDPKTFEIRDGKLYLFYNTVFANTLKSWIKEGPEELRIKADKNWPEIK